MLTYAQLLTLHRSVRTERVLSVYIDGSAKDPAAQRTWEIELSHALGHVRRSLAEAPAGERDAFEHCLAELEERMASLTPAVGSPGWVAFVTATGVQDAHPLPARVPTLAAWSIGASLAPYIGVLKENRAVVVVVADARRARLYQYRAGELHRVMTVRSHHEIEHPSAHMGAPPQQGFHAGTRGTTGHDLAERELLKGRDRMITDTCERAAHLADSDGCILLGGIKRVTARLAAHLATQTRHRVVELDALDVHASDADITAAARAGASAFRDAFDAGRIDDMVEHAGARGTGVIGSLDARRALDLRCVRELYLTRGYLADHVDEAADAVRSALDQDAMVEEASGPAAEKLNGVGGIAAALRFRPAALGDALGDALAEHVG